MTNAQKFKEVFGVSPAVLVGGTKEVVTDWLYGEYGDEIEPELVGFIFKHGEDDYSILQHDLPRNELQKIIDILIEYDTRGCSVRGNAESLIEELREM